MHRKCNNHRKPYDYEWSDLDTEIYRDMANYGNLEYVYKYKSLVCDEIAINCAQFKKDKFVHDYRTPYLRCASIESLKKVNELRHSNTWTTSYGKSYSINKLSYFKSKDIDRVKDREDLIKALEDLKVMKTQVIPECEIFNIEPEVRVISIELSYNTKSRINFNGNLRLSDYLTR